MINGGYPETPDSWIERNLDDPDDPYARHDPEQEDEFDPEAEENSPAPEHHCGDRDP